MSDIVERLRDDAQLKSGSSLNNGCPVCGLGANTCDEAADEIDRPKAALRGLYDEQNDAPLERRRAEWEAAMGRARAALGERE